MIRVILILCAWYISSLYALTLYQYPDVHSEQVATIAKPSTLTLKTVTWLYVEDSKTHQRGWVAKKDLEKATSGTLHLSQSMHLHKQPSPKELETYRKTMHAHIAAMDKVFSDMHQLMHQHSHFLFNYEPLTIAP